MCMRPYVCVCVGPLPLSINAHSDGKIIIFFDFNLQPFRHFRMAMKRPKETRSDRPPEGMFYKNGP